MNNKKIHVAIIPDGNRRWAKSKNISEIKGYEKSGNYERMLKLFEEAKKQSVGFFSIWGFSTENWSRNSYQNKQLFDFFSKSFKKLREDAGKNKMKVIHLGRKDRIPKKLAKELELLERETKNYKDFILQICIDYGGRDEILRAVNKIIKKEKIVDEKKFAEYLDTKNIPDPDLIIRTSGEKRISGFMPFQTAYSELYFTEKHFPDFNENDLREAIKDFKKRKRRFGGN